MSDHRSADPRTSLAALAAKAAAGDRVAFDAVHTRLDGGIRRYFGQRTRDQDLVEELAQKAWTGVWEACSSRRYDPARSAISTFAYAVASKIWLQHLRAAGNRDAAMEMEGLPGLSIEDPGGEAKLGEALETIRMALDGRLSDLTEQERWVLRAAVEAETDRAVAKRLGISPSTAHEAKQSALGKLRRLLSRLGLREDAERSASESQ